MTAVTKTFDTEPKTLRISASNLRRLLRPVVPLVSADPAEHPALGAVLLETRRGWVTASATDRFRAGMSRLPTSCEDGFRVVIPLAELETICDIFLPSGENTVTAALTLIVDGDRLRVYTTGAGEIVEATAIFAVERDFPDLDSLFRNALAAESDGGPLHVNAKRLAGFRDAVHLPLEEHHVEIVGGGRNKPVLLIGGDEFIGLLMPLKLVDKSHTETTPAQEWAEFLAPEEP